MPSRLMVTMSWTIITMRSRVVVAPVVMTMMMWLFAGISSSIVFANAMEEGWSSEAVFSEQSFLPLRRHLNLIDETEDLPPLFPLTYHDFIGFACAIFGLMIAAGGGIGGGGILVPIYVLLLDFPVKHAISLTSVTVLGGAMANNLLNANKKHPEHPKRPCIDWDLILQLEPATIAGTLIGGMLNDFLSDTVLVILLLLLLSVTAYKTLQKANALYEKESLALQQVAETNEEENLIKVDTTYGATITSSNNWASGSAKIQLATQQSSFGAPKQREVWKDAAKLTSLFVVIVCINFIKGGPVEGGGGPFGSQQCGVTCFWVSQGAMLLVIFLFSAWVRATVLNRCDSNNDGPIISDITWNESNTVRYPLMAIVAGLVAGMFGIGGGIVKGPLMLALGVHPAVASATSACMILFTSSTATVSFIVYGLLVYDYAIACLLLGFCSTLLGQTVMALLMKRYNNRSSYIAYSIGIVVLVSALCMTVESILAIMGEI